MCDTVVIIERGRVRAAGKLEDIKQALRARRAGRRLGPADPLVALAVAAQFDPNVPMAAVVVPAPTRTQRVRIQLLRDVESAERLLHEQPGVSGVSVRDKELCCEHAGDGEELAGLLARLVAAGLPVVGFRVEEEDLEDLFMALTDGQVQ